MDRKIVARGVLTSRVSGAGQSQLARTPVQFAVDAQAGRCHVLTLTLHDLQLNLLGLNVDLSEVNLRIFAIGAVMAAASWAVSSVRCLAAPSGSDGEPAWQRRRGSSGPFRATAVVGRDEGASAAQA